MIVVCCSPPVHLHKLPFSSHSNKSGTEGDFNLSKAAPVLFDIQQGFRAACYNPLLPLVAKEGLKIMGPQKKGSFFFFSFSKTYYYIVLQSTVPRKPPDCSPDIPI